MPKFVSTERVPVQVEGDPNTIYIKPKMDYGTRQRVSGTAARFRATTESGATPEAEFDLGAYNIALLTHNIVGWEGPDFEGVECTPENIERLDPDDALLDEVLRQINDRNVSKAVTSPNSRTNGRSSTTKAKGAPVAE